ncbi:Adducin-related protein [Xylogone sp. PMI_703]|nr:Adducin-related protein [Xylogone sp. PMI_703]
MAFLARFTAPKLRVGVTAAKRYASTFSASTYTPDDRYNTPNVGGLLKKSILDTFTPQEAKTRIELAACYRLFEMKGWNENIYNHLTAKVQEEDGTESFLINPFGLRYGEITASSLIKVGSDGSIRNPGVTRDLFGINDAGFVIHSAIHRARPDLQSVMHCHYPSAAGVSAVKQGFMELAQTSHQIGPIAYHDYQGIVVDRNEQKSLVQDLGEKKILFLRNHGVITAGESVGEAWYLMYQLIAATDLQSHASACALGREENLVIPARETVTKTFEVMRKKHFSGAPYGVKELSAYMRLLDSIDPSYRT